MKCKLCGREYDPKNNLRYGYCRHACHRTHVRMIKRVARGAKKPAGLKA